MRPWLVTAAAVMATLLLVQVTGAAAVPSLAPAEAGPSLPSAPAAAPQTGCGAAVLPGEGPVPPTPPGADLDLDCEPAIRPGARMFGPSVGWCTLNFVVTDGTDLYIGAAGHCVRVGERIRVAGVPGEVGTVVHRDFGDPVAPYGDWGFVRIDDEDHVHVNATMCRWGGPVGEEARAPLPGEPVFHYGWGVWYNSEELRRGRAGETVAPGRVPPLVDATEIVFAGFASGGDSGSPVLNAQGQAAGILTAGIDLPDPHPGVVIARDFSMAMEDLEAFLGRDVRVVEGGPFLGVVPSVP